MVPDIADYFGYGQSKMPSHRSDTSTCPCMGCRKTRGVSSGLRAQSEAVRFILNLKFLKWLVEEGRLTDG